jgi:hypothetical protein
VSVCVVNSHLAAHDHNQQQRVESYNNVLGSHTFAHKAGVFTLVNKQYCPVAALA